ncbi:U-box domain-containing protein [Drosera capensis]
MWLPKENGYKKERTNALIAVAIDKDKGSQLALKWAIDNLLQRGQTVVLIHVKLRPPGSLSSSASLPLPNTTLLGISASLLVKSFRCAISGKEDPSMRGIGNEEIINCKDIILEDTDVGKALIEYTTQTAIEVLVLGSSSKGGFLSNKEIVGRSRFSKTDIPGVVSKGAPDFCTVYVISKNKISSMRSASRPAPSISSLRNQIMNAPTTIIPATPPRNSRGSDRGSPRLSSDDMEFRSPFTRGVKVPNVKSYGELLSDSDISFVSSGRPSVDRAFPSLYDTFETGKSPNRLSTSSDNTDYTTDSLRRKSIDISSPPSFSQTSDDSGSHSWSGSQPPGDDLEAEMRRLKLELKQTMDMYSNACKEALTAKQKASSWNFYNINLYINVANFMITWLQAMELQRWKLEEEQKMEEARLAEEAALALPEKEKPKSRAALEDAEAAKRIAELESQKRINAEMKALKESEEKKTAMKSVVHSTISYRRYTIEQIEAATEFFTQTRKIGEGGYGPVYKCHLDHTPVAIKVLRPDAAQGRSQFQQEVEVLSCIRHPNMVLLLGACPEYGCLVYEYMHNGSLEDRLFCRGGTPPLSWQHRFRIAAEIATGLLFLHQTKPEPLVHRDLKPGNILLDRNLVSKISDVGLARLVPPSIADTVTQYRMTSTAGTFCYIDPEYQQTGMLGVKSDVYSLGVMLLQIITAKSPMGLTHYMERAIEKGTFKEMLDPAVRDWPVEEALKFAELSLTCAELRRRDRPDLGTVVLPELNRLRMLAEESMGQQSFRGVDGFYYATPSQSSLRPDVTSCSTSPYDSYRSRSSAASTDPELK